MTEPENEFEDLLKRVGWSKRYVANKWGVHYNTVGNWKEDPPKWALRDLSQVARLLGV